MVNNMNDSKSDSKNHEKSPHKQKTPSENKFTLISPQSISVMAETVGISSLPDQITTALAEDASYRLREIVQNCIQIMHHSKRVKLASEDLNLALTWSDILPISSSVKDEPAEYVHIKEHDIHVLSEKIIDLSQEYSYFMEIETSSNPTMSVHWIHADSNKDSVAVVNESTALEIHREAFRSLSNVLLSSSSATTEVALKTLRNNTRLGPIIPLLVNFLKDLTLSCKANCKLASRIVKALHCLSQNNVLNIEPEATSILNILKNILTNFPENVSREEDFELTQQLSGCLAFVIKKFALEIPNFFPSFVEGTLGNQITNNEGSLDHQLRLLVILRTISCRYSSSLFNDQLKRFLEQLRNLQKRGNDTRFVEYILTLSVRDVLMSNLDENLNSQVREDLNAKIYEEASKNLGPRLSIFCSGIQLENDVDSRSPGSEFNEFYWTLKPRPTPKQKFRFWRREAFRLQNQQNLEKVFDVVPLKIPQFQFRVRGFQQKPAETLVRRKFAAEKNEPSLFCKLSVMNLNPVSKLNPFCSKIITNHNVFL